jgi:undecaprenyl diphosphate synthase
MGSFTRKKRKSWKSERMSHDLLQRLQVHGAVPAHVAIIMDGNGRWAKGRSLPRALGHHAGMKAVREVVEGCLEAGVGVLTLFAFSQENWQRPASEIEALMKLLEEYIAREAQELRQQGVSVRILGHLERLGPGARKAIDRIMSETQGGQALALNLCISYSARAEIARAARLLAESAAAGRLDPADIDEDAVSRMLYTAEWPDPDLLIRTSGEMRISNFLLWQLAYAELYVTPVLWPDFTRRHLFEAILEFQGRDRRFGRVPV